VGIGGRAIGFLYASGTGMGGIAGPWLFGVLIDTGSRASLFAGYALGAVLMIVAAAVAWRWGIAAERKSLEAGGRPPPFVDRGKPDPRRPGKRRKNASALAAPPRGVTPDVFSRAGRPCAPARSSTGRRSPR